MKIKSNEMKVGQKVRFEYGNYGNWVTGELQEVVPEKNSIRAMVLAGGRVLEVYFSLSEEVELLNA